MLTKQSSNLSTTTTLRDRINHSMDERQLKLCLTRECLMEDLFSDVMPTPIST